MSIWQQLRCIAIATFTLHLRIYYHLQHGLVAHGLIPLRIAAENGHVAIVKKLLMAKANINHQCEVQTSIITT